MAQSTTSNAGLMNFGQAGQPQQPLTQGQTQSFAPPASNSGGSIWSGLLGFMANPLGGQPETINRSTTPGGTTIPSMGDLGIGNMGVPYNNPGGGTNAPSSSNLFSSPTTTPKPNVPFVSTANAATPSRPSTPVIGGAAQGGLTADQIAAGNANADKYSNDPNVNPSINKSSPSPATVGADTGDSKVASGSSSSNDQGSQVNAIISNLQTAGNITPEEQALRQQIADTQQSLGLGQAAIAGNPEGMQLQTGQSNVLQQQGLAKLNALTAQLGNLQAQRQASLQSQTAAGNLAQQEQGFQQQVTPISPGNSLYSNFSGKQVGGNGDLNSLNGGSSGGFINTLAQSVASGNTSYDDAVKQLPSSAQAPALLSAINAINPQFSITSSNQNAQARGTALQSNATQGVALQRAQVSANSALDTLSGALSSLNTLETSGTAGTNTVAQWIAGQLNDPSVGSYNTALTDARAQLQGFLDAVGATTPTGAKENANTYLPDGMNAASLSSHIATAKQLMQQKVDAFNTTGGAAQYGNSGSSSGQTNGSIYNF